MSKGLPAGFARYIEKDRQVVAHADIAGAVRDVVRNHHTLYDWAADQPQPRALRGRAPVYVATLPTGDTLAVRHAWHGGLLAPITRDLWLSPPRAERELRKSVALQNGGIPTASVLGYVTYPVAPGVVRVDVMSRFLESTFDLAAVLSDFAPGIEFEQATEAVRVLLKQLEVQRLVHPDLNAKNILIQKTDNRPVAFVIDVDVMRHKPGIDGQAVHRANLSRLLRSLRKFRHQLEATEDFYLRIKGILMNVPFEPDPVLPPIVAFDG